MKTFSIRSSFVLPSSCNGGTRCAMIDRFSCSNCSGDFCKSSFALSTLLKAEPLATNNEKIFIQIAGLSYTYYRQRSIAVTRKE